MTAIRPPIHNLERVLTDLQRWTGLSWTSCANNDAQVMALSADQTRYNTIETEPAGGFTAMAELSLLCQRRSLYECAAAVNGHQAKVLGQN